MVPLSDGGHSAFSDIGVEDNSVEWEKVRVTSQTGRAPGQSLEDTLEKLNAPVELGEDLASQLWPTVTLNMSFIPPPPCPPELQFFVLS